MSRKTTAYTRKRNRGGQPHSFNGAAYLNTIQNCRPHTDEPIPGSTLEGTHRLL